MSLDLDGLRRAVATHRVVARVVIATARGSTPRSVGTAMLVWADGQAGTIGGGMLEFQAVSRARTALMHGDRTDKVPLGPAIGQCCGGAVTLLTEVFDEGRVADLSGTWLRRMPGASRDHPPPKLQTRVLESQNNGTPAESEASQGWFLEPIHSPSNHLWVWGAGHVGRAMVAAMAPLPEWHITWVDTAGDRFPTPIPKRVETRSAANPEDLVADSPCSAHHLILTYSHALDLELCHRLLTHTTGSIGLIGSTTKWARFRTRLMALGHTDPDRIVCPIGDPCLGKHPQAIALGTATGLVRARRISAPTEEAARA